MANLAPGTVDVLVLMNQIKKYCSDWMAVHLYIGELVNHIDNETEVLQNLQNQVLELEQNLRYGSTHINKGDIITLQLEIEKVEKEIKASSKREDELKTLAAALEDIIESSLHEAEKMRQALNPNDQQTTTFYHVLDEIKDIKLKFIYKPPSDVSSVSPKNNPKQSSDGATKNSKSPRPKSSPDDRKRSFDSPRHQSSERKSSRHRSRQSQANTEMGPRRKTKQEENEELVAEFNLFRNRYPDDYKIRLLKENRDLKKENEMLRLRLEIELKEKIDMKQTFEYDIERMKEEFSNEIFKKNKRNSEKADGYKQEIKRLNNLIYKLTCETGKSHESPEQFKDAAENREEENKNETTNTEPDSNRSRASLKDERQYEEKQTQTSDDPSKERKSSKGILNTLKKLSTCC